MAARVFFSYSHDDEAQRNQLDKHLALLKRQDRIESWHDRSILAGEAIDDAIGAELERANIILLLVSASFIASNYCYSNEMSRAMQRHELGEARVVPVILRNCDWHSAPFGKLKAVPKDGKAIASWANPDDAYTDVARELRTLVEALSGKGPELSSITALPASGLRPEQVRAAPATIRDELPRSGNLRVRQQFSDLDKSRFLTATFEYIARFFEGTLGELSKRNADIEGDFQRIDAVSFIATVYRQGKRVSACAIRLHGSGTLGSGITYSQDVSRTDGNSYNERVSVESDDQSLYLRSMGMASMFSGGAERTKLSQEGAAEMFWAILVQPLQ